jgi:hypothetical protein
MVSLLILLLMTALAVLVITERRRVRAQFALETRRAFDRLVGELSAAFLRTPAHRVDQEISRWLVRLLDHFGIDGAALGRFSESTRELRLTHVAGIDHAALLRASHALHEFRAGGDCQHAKWEPGALAVPLVARESTLGVLALVMRRPDRVWSDDLTDQLGLVGDVLAIAILRSNAERALRGSRALGTAVRSVTAARASSRRGRGLLHGRTVALGSPTQPLGEPGELRH